MIKRIFHWIFASRKKQCRHCCINCQYFTECEKDGGLSAYAGKSGCSITTILIIVILIIKLRGVLNGTGKKN